MILTWQSNINETPNEERKLIFSNKFATLYKLHVNFNEIIL